MPLNFDLVGAPEPAHAFSYTWKDCALYALGIGAKTATELSFLYEGQGPKVMPTFAVVPSFPPLSKIVAKLGADVRKLLHGEQTVVLHRPIPPNATLQTVATVTGIYDKGKGALAVIESKTTDENAAPIFDNISSLFLRGEGGFGGPRGPETAPPEKPDGAPAFQHHETTSPEQAALYRLSGDLNPLHIFPPFAAAGGFDRPILHGLCTYGFAARAVLARLCDGDPARLARFFARFTGVVFPGDTLTTSGWKLADGSYFIEVQTQDGRTVLGQSLAHVR